MNIIGRQRELKQLSSLLQSPSAEFCTVVGRRRIGKTYLIRQFFKTKKVVFFNATGMKNGAINTQIQHFAEQIGEAFLNGITPQVMNTWESAFRMLTDVIQNAKKNQKIILFLDEFPWMATRNSRVLQTLDYYWNQHWSKDDRIKLII